MYKACVVDECNEPTVGDEMNANRCELFAGYINSVVEVLNEKNIDERTVDFSQWRTATKCQTGMALYFNDAFPILYSFNFRGPEDLPSSQHIRGESQRMPAILHPTQRKRGV